MQSDFWTLGGYEFQSRVLLGTARYPSPESLRQAILASGTEIVTVSLRRQTAESGGRFWELIRRLDVKVLPNTAGCHSVDEAVTTAKMAREVFGTNWIKLETVGDETTLQPDPFALVEATRQLRALGFEVFPYMTEDLAVAERLVALGCTILMPWGSPIGSGLGLLNPLALKRLRARYPHLNLIVDAGLGAPSHAAQAFELGFDGVLLNSAVSLAADPPLMARAFRLAAESGRAAHLAGCMPAREFAQASTPNLGRPFWHHETEKQP